MNKVSKISQEVTNNLESIPQIMGLFIEVILYFSIKEWLPGAKEVYLFGEFNNWNRKEFPLKKTEFGMWEINI